MSTCCAVLKIDNFSPPPRLIKCLGVFFDRGFPQRFLAKLRKTERNSEEFSKPLRRREA